MSVTFTPTIDFTTTLFTIVCGCGTARMKESFSYAAAYAFIQDASFVAPSCGDEFCGAFTAHISEANPVVNVNVSNMNAKTLLGVLGIENTGDLTGVLSAEDFLGRVLIALGVNPSDAGIPATQDGLWNDMGRSERYTDVRLLELEEIARYAVQNNVTVSWS